MATSITAAFPQADDLTMSSLEIAELTGKRHKHVIQDIRKMLTGLEKQSDEFSSDYTDGRGRTQQHFILDHDHVMCLVTGYKVQLRMAVIQRLRALEEGTATPWHEQEPDTTPAEIPDFTNPAEAARAWADQFDGREEAERLSGSSLGFICPLKKPLRTSRPETRMKRWVCAS